MTATSKQSARSETAAGIAVATTVLPPSCEEAVSHLRDAIRGGQEWLVALLEAMALWTLPEEVYRGRFHRYLIAGEAFDRLLLAKRLVDECDGLVPSGECAHLRTEGEPLESLPWEEYRRLVGVTKYQTSLNYWYGVTVEVALLGAVQEEVRKERMSRALSPRSRRVPMESFRRIYGEVRSPLMQEFLMDREPPPCPLAPGGLAKEFTYWLFRRRVRGREGARVASDTRKALEWMQRRGGGTSTGAGVVLDGTAGPRVGQGWG